MSLANLGIERDVQGRGERSAVKSEVIRTIRLPVNRASFCRGIARGLALLGDQ